MRGRCDAVKIGTGGDGERCDDALTAGRGAGGTRPGHVVSDTPAIKLDQASLRFDQGPLWDGLSLAVARGEFLAVLGPNGSGKTSLLRVLLGLQALSDGRAEILGRLPHRGNPRRPRAAEGRAGPRRDRAAQPPHAASGHEGDSISEEHHRPILS